MCRTGREEHVLDHPKLASSRDWALLKLDEWLNGDGRCALDAVAETWGSKTFEPVRSPFGGAKGPPQSPRDMAEWLKAIDQAYEWLGARWEEEINVSPWINENQLFQLLKRAF
jgi:hypothetical protein